MPAFAHPRRSGNRRGGARATTDDLALGGGAEAQGDHARRLIAAGLRCIARWGLAKTTLDDVAREAGCSRATVYRTFPGGKDALIEALVAVEVGRALTHLDHVVARTDALEDVLVEGLVAAAELVRDHHALQFLIAHEPEAVLPHLAFGEMDAVLRSVSAIAGPHLARFMSTEEAARAAEWVARLFFSYTLAPSPEVDLTDRMSVRRLVQTYVLPGLPSPESPQPPKVSALATAR